MSHLTREWTLADFEREWFVYHLTLWTIEYTEQLNRLTLLDAVYDAMTNLPGNAGCAGSC